MIEQEDLLDVALFVVKKMDKNTRIDLLMNLIPDNKKSKVLEDLGYEIKMQEGKNDKG